MKMPAGLLSGRAAGMKHRRPFPGRNARQFHFLESRRGNEGDLLPMNDVRRGDSPRFTEFPVSRVAAELPAKQLNREAVEFVFGKRRQGFPQVRVKTASKI